MIDPPKRVKGRQTANSQLHRKAGSIPKMCLKLRAQWRNILLLNNKQTSESSNVSEVVFEFRKLTIYPNHVKSVRTPPTKFDLLNPEAFQGKDSFE